MGIGGTAKMHLLGEYLGHEVLATDNNARYQIGVSTEILGTRVDDQVKAHRDGVAGPRCREGVVDDGDESVLLGNRGHGLEIAYLEDGVRKRLDVEHLGVLLNRRLIGRRVPHVRHRDLDAESREILGDQTVCATIAVSARDHVVVLRKQSQ